VTISSKKFFDTKLQCINVKLVIEQNQGGHVYSGKCQLFILSGNEEALRTDGTLQNGNNILQLIGNSVGSW